MRIIVTLYLITTIASVVASAPQIRQLLRMKNSDEFNLYTYNSWFIAQIISLVYAVAIRSIPYILVNILWVGYYIVMITLIVRYRPHGAPVSVNEE
ncbi:MAG TPA: PQ-loop domain-containing transporter [Candidatus Saccharimonadales bacterium]|nr:PQ-loop domain-containing transporter [Candidatus Saccharimonadales bacterium]